MPTATRLSSPVSPTEDPLWRLVEEGFDLAPRARDRIAVHGRQRLYWNPGSLEGSFFSAPAAFIAGLFDRGTDPGSVRELVVASDWTQLCGAIDGQNLHDVAVKHSGECLTCAKGSSGASGRAATRADASPACGVFVWRRWPIVACVALRDFGLLLGALTLARPAWSYDTPLKRDRS